EPSRPITSDGVLFAWYPDLILCLPRINGEGRGSGLSLQWPLVPAVQQRALGCWPILTRFAELGRAACGITIRVSVGPLPRWRPNGPCRTDSFLGSRRFHDLPRCL